MHTMSDISSDSDEDLSPITENLSSSLVDPSKLVTKQLPSLYPVGMDNFKSKKVKSTPKSPSISINISSAENGSHHHHQNEHGQVRNGPNLVARQRWKTAALKLKLIKDPWYEFHIEKYPVETVIRHRDRKSVV